MIDSRRRSLGHCYAPGLAILGKFVDTPSAGVISVVFQPVAQFGPFGTIGGGVHIALKQNMSHQNRVIHLSDEPVGAAPFGTFLKRKNFAIQR